MTFQFFLNSILFGIGLAMDAFSVSLANGLKSPKMKMQKMLLIAAVFAIFQAMMPLIGWFFVTKLVDVFSAFEKFIPYISLILLCYIGGKMLYEGIDCYKEEKNQAKNGEAEIAKETECPCISEVTIGALLLQGVATSIDALSVGFTIAHLTFPLALLEASIIAIVTFGICFGGICIGKKFGTVLSSKASIFGGAILVAIGFEIFISSLF